MTESILFSPLFKATLAKSYKLTSEPTNVLCRKYKAKTFWKFSFFGTSQDVEQFCSCSNYSFWPSDTCVRFIASNSKFDEFFGNNINIVVREQSYPKIEVQQMCTILFVLTNMLQHFRRVLYVCPAQPVDALLFPEETLLQNAIAELFVLNFLYSCCWRPCYFECLSKNL